jgi:hypothetical protein
MVPHRPIILDRLSGLVTIDFTLAGLCLHGHDAAIEASTTIDAMLDRDDMDGRAVRP